MVTAVVCLLVGVVVGIFAGMWNRRSVCCRAYAAGVADTRESEANANGYGSVAMHSRLPQHSPEWVLVDRQITPTNERPPISRKY